MVLTREERESLVIDLLNKCTPIREIAKQAGLSFRDIGVIKKKAEEEKEAKQGQAQQIFASTQAYKLFRRQISGTSSYRIKHTVARSSQVLCRVLESGAIS
jgi:hypothetical protein